MHLSKSSIYAIRAILYLVMNSNRSFITISTISKELGISYHYLTKILQILTDEGITESFKGSNGGVRLIKPADEICLMDIIKHTTNPERLFCDCPLGLEGCGSNHPCPMYQKWNETNEMIREMIATVSISEFMKLKKMLPETAC